jgi:cysteine synthase
MNTDIANSDVVIYTGPHQITGNGVGFKPDILDMDVMDKVLEVSTLLSSTMRFN